MQFERQTKYSTRSQPPVSAKFLEHSMGQELFTELREFISANWNIDETTSASWVNEAVATIDARIHRRNGASNPVAIRGGLGICRERKVLDFIEVNLDRRVPVKQLASLARLSVSQFQRAFRQSFGVAAHMYVLQARVNRAKNMMMIADTCLSEIAVACGFSDQSHMSRVFTKFVGEPPNSWRKRQNLLVA